VPFSFHQELAKLSKTDTEKADQLLDKVEAEKWGGDKYEAVIEATGLSYESVRRAKEISDRFEFGRRRPNLSFKHHAEVASGASCFAHA
jgi:hypothetical protein